MSVSCVNTEVVLELVSQLRACTAKHAPLFEFLKVSRPLAAHGSVGQVRSAVSQHRSTVLGLLVGFGLQPRWPECIPSAPVESATV